MSETSLQADADRPRDNLKRRAILGSSYEAIGFGTSQVLRLGSNILLTRLLSPEAFGLSALVVLVNQGLVMFSDVGLLPALVQHERGGEESFLNTAWSMQVLRALVLGLVAVLLAWPIALLYEEPQLLSLLMVGGIGILTHGLTSTALYSLRRQVRVGPLVVLELAVQVLSLGLTVLLALWLRNVWALVWGMVVSGMLHAALSYLLPRDHRHRWVLDPEAKRAILNSGKWVLLSSAVGFTSSQADRLITGKLVGITELGVYSVAVLLSGAVAGAVYKVTHGVTFPVLSQLRSEGHERLKAAYYRARLAVELLAMPALGGLCALGSVVVQILYDDRYAEAGWMLQLLVIRSAMIVMLAPCETCLFSIGLTKYAFLQGLVRAIWIAAAVPVGYVLYGFPGLVVATALAEVPVLVLLWRPFWREGLLAIHKELRSVLLFGVGFGAGIPVEHVMQRWLA